MEKSVLLRLSIVFIPPFIFVVILYCLFFVKENIDIGKITGGISEVEKGVEFDIRSSIKNTLLRQGQRLGFLEPTINPEWFLYSIRLRNNIKLAVVSDTAQPSYLERETLLTLITDKEVPILYGENKIISSDIKREEILNNFSGYRVSFEGDYKQVFGPNSNVEIQHSPSLGIASYAITLSYWSALLIYISVLIGWSGLIIIAKDIFRFIYFGKRWWCKI